MDSKPYWAPFRMPPQRKTWQERNSKFTDEQIAELDKQNLENYCHFHRTGLRKMIKGTHSHELFDKNERYELGKRGLILRRFNPKTGDHWLVSQLAIELLETF